MLSDRPTLLRFALALALAGVPFARARSDDANRSARWEKAIAAFEEKDKSAPPPHNAIVFVGSSTIRFWDIAKSFPGMKVINRGFGGSELADSVAFAPRIVLPYEPRIVVLYAGDNDLAAGKSPEKVAEDFRAFARLITTKLPNTQIIYLSIKPSPARSKIVDQGRKANELIAEQCKKEKRVTFLDVATSLLGSDGMPRKELFRNDGLHLNAKGYELWANLLKPYLR